MLMMLATRRQIDARLVLTVSLLLGLLDWELNLLAADE